MTTPQLSNLLWAERPSTLIDILKDSSLPTVVKMNAKEKDKKEGAKLLQQPLVLYKELKGFKVVARNVSSLEAVPLSKGGVAYREGGSVIVIPVDYQGWFRILEENSVPVLNVANLARIMPLFFLSATKFPGFSLLDPLKKDFMYEKLFFPAGLYRVISVFEDFVKYKADKAGTKRKLLRCLVCESKDGIDVLIPFDVTGEFYIVEHKKSQAKASKGDNNARAYTLQQLVELGVFKKPLAVKLLLGEQPNKPCGFTGIMKVVDILEDWTVIGSALDGSRKLMELPVAPFPEFLQALNGKDLLETGSLHSEYSYLKSGVADKYASEIKVRQRFALHENSNSNERVKKAATELGELERLLSKTEGKPRELKPIKRTSKSIAK